MDSITPDDQSEFVATEVFEADVAVQPEQVHESIAGRALDAAKLAVYTVVGHLDHQRRRMWATDKEIIRYLRHLHDK